MKDGNVFGNNFCKNQFVRNIIFLFDLVLDFITSNLIIFHINISTKTVPRLGLFTIGR